jgi:hypothetical protein
LTLVLDLPEYILVFCLARWSYLDLLKCIALVHVYYMTHHLCYVSLQYNSDELSVTLNANADAVSLSYTPLVSPLAPKCSELDQLTEAPTFITSVSYETATRGMTIPSLLPQTKPPMGLKFFPRSQGAQSLPGVKAPDEQGTPTSYMMKYWYIILPLFLMGLINTGGGDDTAAAPAEGAAAPAVAASAAKPSPGKARRGKRS